MNITFEFACRDDCLDNMVPSDLRAVVGERDKLRAENERLRKLTDQLLVKLKAQALSVLNARAALEQKP